MVCSFSGILRAVSSLLKRFFFACVVTWELLGNIRSEELEGHLISRVQTEKQSMQSAGVQSFHCLERLRLRGCCGRFRHNRQSTEQEIIKMTMAKCILLR